MDGISLKVDVAQVKAAEQALDKFSNSADKATNAADKFESASGSLASAIGKTKQGTVDAINSQDKLTEKYFKQIDAIKNTANATDKLLEIQKKVRADSKNLGSDNSNALLADISAKYREAENAQNKLASQKERFITALKKEAETMKMSRLELLSYNATQLGAMDQAEAHIKQIEATSRDQLEAARQAALTTQKERFISALKEEATTLNMTKVELLSYKAAQMGVLDQAEAHIKQFSLAETYKKEEAAQALLTSQKERFIASLREEVTTMNMSKAELLSYRATQLGVLDQADIYIKQLNNQANALNLAGLSHKQYQQAMRFLPMQITDVVTSLSSGMPVWMVAIQQGGQIKDSFGGVSNTFKALMSLITPAKLAIAGAAGGFALFTKAVYDASVETNELNKALALTGNYAGMTAGNVLNTAINIADGVSTVRQATKALTQTITAGTFSPKQFDLIAKSALEMEKATGKAVSDTIKDFERLQNAPTQTLIELNKQMHFLTSAQYEQVKALEDSGRKTEAAELANTAYSRALKGVADNVKENLGTIETAWNSVKKSASEAWDAMLNIGRKETLEQQLSELDKKIAGIQKGIVLQTTGNFALDDFAKNHVEGAKRELPALERQREMLLSMKTIQDSIGQIAVSESEAREKNLQTTMAQEKYAEQTLTWQEKRIKALNNFWADVAKAPEKYSAELRKRVVDDINNQFKPPKEMSVGGYKDSAGTSLLLEAQKRYEVLQAELRTLATQGLAYEKMTEDRKKLVELDAQSALLREKAAKEGLTKEQQSILAMNDQLRAQYELNAIESERLNGRKDALQVEKSIADKMIEIRQSLIQIDGARGLSARESAVWNEKNQAKIDFERAGGNIGDLNSPATQQYLAALDLIDQKHQKIWESQRDWKSAFSTGIKDWVDDASNIVKSTDEIIDTSMNGAISNLSQALQGSVVDWKSWGVSVLSMIGEVITKLAVASAMQSAMGALGGGGGIGGSIGNITSLIGGIIPNAKGGVYNSPSLSQYSGQVVSNPTLFAFAKGAGLMGEAGPEAIMPLKRSADGSLGVRAIIEHVQVPAQQNLEIMRPNLDMMRNMAMGDVHVNVVVNNTGTGQSEQQSSVNAGDSLGKSLGIAIKQAIVKELGQGGAINVFVGNKMGR